ncbi:olfactory receptor 52A1-like [Mixophyes fleayi]|uniref:olfactory receptor 52A1-like n=1 Tax=Mixophyes fleayi TaxID=3061075 RepID=UPI003F4D89AB
MKSGNFIICWALETDRNLLGEQSDSSSHPNFFILVGIPGLENAHKWISIFFCIFYILTMLGNITLLVVISASPGLHKPMFIFLSILASNDILLSTCMAPKVLCIFWFNSRLISFDSCLLQMFFIHSFSSVESGLLFVMAFDRYIAICQPLRYGSTMTNNLIGKLVIVLLVRAAVLVGPCLILIKRFPAFKTNIIEHSYCEHMAVVKLAAADIRINSGYGLFVAFTILSGDLLFILISYSMIFRAVFSLPSKDSRLRAFNTCAPHICIFLTFYVLAIFSFLSHRYGKRIPPYIHIILSDMYLLVPPMLNPLVYGMKTKQIREQFWKVFCEYWGSSK